METKSIMIVGVGGQGSLLASKLLGRLLVVGTIGTKLGFFGICFGDPAAWTIALVPLIPVYYYRLTKLQKKIGGEVEWQR